MAEESFMRLIGDQGEVAVERALAELRSGRPVSLSVGTSQYVVMGAENISDENLSALEALAGTKPWLVLSQPRLRSLGCEFTQPGLIQLDGIDAVKIHDMIVKTDFHLNGYVPKAAGESEDSALELVKLAYLLPAAVIVELPRERVDDVAFLTNVNPQSLKQYRKNVINTPRIVSRAPVPLDDIGKSEFVVFRGGEGMRDQVAVIIGKPDLNEPVYVRLHSACLTGDLFASLKCDCGDQLRGSAKFMAENGGGVILYLDQEGRGNGIANKIRAYGLQHTGYSTYDADEVLGFDLDQRRFDFAAAMLKQLGFEAIKLLTNNPIKVAALKEAGLDVVSSHRARARFTLENVAYLAAKRDRAGHLIEDDIG